MAQGSTSDLVNKALETGGNLAVISLQLLAMTEMLQLLLVEQRITNDLLLSGLNLGGVNLDALRNDPSYRG